MSDNTTAVSCIQNQGSLRPAGCNEIVRSIWLWDIQKGVWLMAAHIPGVQNVEANRLSRDVENGPCMTIFFG